jgi:hypothetical protein
MLRLTRIALAAVLGVALLAASSRAANLTDSLKKGTPELQSAGALAFGPEGILFVGDAKGAAIFAIDTGDNPKAPATGALNVKGVDAKIASLLGTEARAIKINDLVVNPASGKAYLSVARGTGAQATPVLLRVDRKGQIEEVPTKDVKFAKAALPNAPGANARGGRGPSPRMQSITKLAYVKGHVYVAGLSNEEWASTLRSIPFPFTEADKGTGVQIWHGAHGRFETQAPVRTFVPYDIKGETHLLAAYTCTPLVKFPVSELKAGKKVKGTTIAELGNRNSPIDMIAYQKDGKDYLLIANSARGLMKVTTENIDKSEPITQPIRGGGKAGLKYQTIENLPGTVQQLDQLDKENVLLLVRTKDGELNLATMPLP